jgi:16S rRNA processing protein RimM
MTQVLIGTIVSTSGIKGYVRVNTVTETPDDLREFPIAYDALGNSYNIKRVISTKGTIAIVEIAGVTFIDEAKKLIGTELFIDRDTFDDLSDDSYYYVDLIGAVVYIDQEEYGEVVDVVNYGASDIIEVRELKTNKLVMYPFIDDFIYEVNIEERKIILREKLSPA